nr:T9SS type A sorting domain-containing protein [uncultured Carboxylicivirga sp.]
MKKIYYFFVLFLLFNSGTLLAQTPTPPGEIASGLVYWLRADLGVSGDPVTLWADQSGNSNNAVSTGGIKQITSNGLDFNSSLEFDGVSGMTIGDDARINTSASSERSMAIVFRTGDDINNLMFLYEQGGSTHGYNVYLRNGFVYVNVWTNGSNVITISDEVNENTDYVLTFIWNNGDLTGKLNNEDFSNTIISSSSISIGSHSGDISIGYTDGTTRLDDGTTASSGNYYSGEIAEISYYDRALTSIDESSIITDLSIRYDINVKTWYTLAGGDWDNPAIWTLDPAGMVSINPDNSYPQSSTDKIVILQGRTVNMPDGNGDYSSPLRDLSVSCDVLTVNGRLDLRSSSQSSFNTVKGSGTILMDDDNFPSGDATHFITKGQGEGTVEYYGTNSISLTNGDEFYNIVVNISNDQNLEIDQDLKINGNLVVNQGRFKIGDSNGISRTIDIYGNVVVEAGARMDVGSTNSFHWLNIYGNLTNNGNIDFARNSQYDESTGGAVKVKFKGSTNTAVVINGRTDFYRIFVDKGSDKTFSTTISATATGLFNLYGPVTGTTTDASDGAAGWQRLPIVIENGTLQLGNNIEIDRLGENMSGNSPNELTIPETGRLWINGATVSTASGAGGWRGLSLFGTLKITSGSFTTPGGTGGVAFGTQGNIAPRINVEGGDLYLTQIRNYFGGNLFSYLQSGGNVHFNNQSSDIYANPTFNLDLPSFTFNMSGGKIIYSAANHYWAGDFYVKISEENYSITGGTIEIQTLSTGSFDIYSEMPIYNLDIKSGTGTNPVRVVDQYGNPTANSYLNILNDISVASGTTFNDGGGQISIGGDMIVEGTYSPSGSLAFNGSQDGAIINNTGSTLVLPGLFINKDRHPNSGEYYSIDLTGSQNIEIDGTLRITRGALDVVNFWPTVSDSVVISDGDLTSSGTGGLELIGSSPVLQGKFGKESNFGNIRLNNGDGGMSIATDINVEDFSFASSGSGKVYMGTYNFTVAGNVSNYSSNRYFETADNSSDGGLTLTLTIPNSNSTVGFYPVGTNDGSTTSYAPATVYSIAGEVDSPSGYFTIIPVNKMHPSTDPSKSADVLHYYWKSKSTGFNDLDDGHVRIMFASPLTVKGFSAAYLDGYEWKIGTTKYGNGDYDIYFDNNATNGVYMNLLNTDYTAGLDNGNGKIPIASVKVYRSTGNSTDWNTSSSWEYYNGSVWVSGVPGSSDVAVVQAAHTITINTGYTALASQVQIDGILSVKDGGSGTIDIIKGSGTLIYEENSSWANGIFNILNGDHTEFCNNADATIEFTGACNPGFLPSTSQLPYFPNLKISGTNEIRGYIKDGVADDIIVNRDLIIESGKLNTIAYQGQIITVGGDVNITGGELTFFTTNNSNRYFDIEGDINISGGEFNDANGNESNIYLRGNINKTSGNINLSSSIVVFEGTESAEFINSSGTASFNRIEINKPIDQRVIFSDNFLLSGSTNGTKKALILTSGECYLDDAAIDINLTTGGTANPFTIPAESKLFVTSGKVNSSGNSGVKLSGSLIINGGIANIDGTIAGGGNSNSSYIEFTSSGSSYIEVSNSGTLNVGDQLRRSTISDEGILTFVQNNGTVNIGTVGDDINNTRGMFEILGTGSSFSQGTDDVITISNTNGSSSIASLYFYPETSTVLSGSGFSINASGDFGINADKALNAISLSGAVNAELYIRPLTLNEQLTIGAGTTFSQNGFDFTLKGDLTNNGTFDGGTNTTFFTGVSDQIINGTATTTFYNFEKSGGTGELSIEMAGVEIENALTIEDGQINTNAYSVIAKGNVINNGAVLTDSGDGLILGGTSGAQGITGVGSFDALMINNVNGANVPNQAQAFTINKQLKLSSGIFDIGGNLLTISEGATIVDASNGITEFGPSKMVQTNLSFTDAGVEKLFESPYSGKFVYPIGSFGKYTPVTIDVNSNTSAGGSIRVKAANEPHVSVLDESKVLQYNWSLDADNVSGFTADVTFQYLNADAWGDESKYINAKILLDSDVWNKSDGTIDIALNQIKYSWVDADDLVIDGDYTAGEPEAIPDKLPAYVTVKDGSWDDIYTWAKYNPSTNLPGVAGDSIPAGGPSGAVVYVEHTLTLPATPAKSSYRTHILETGVIDLGTTFGHRLGYVDGTGTIRFDKGAVLPAGIYDDFVSTSGGTIQYDGTDSYDVMGELSAFNNVLFTGSGDRRMSADVVVNGSFNINGPNVVHPTSTTIYLGGDLLFESGSYEANIGSKIAFVGGTQQVVNTTVNFTGSNAVYDLEIDNSEGLLIEKPLEVKENLILTNGIIEVAETGASFTLSSPDQDVVLGGSATSYVNGLMYKNIATSGESFDFPVGDAYRYGNIVVSPEGTSTGYWAAQYFSPNQWNPTVKSSNVAFVSSNENWKVEAPAEGKSANIELRWDNQSGVVKSNLQVVYWANNASDEWDEIAYANASGDDNNGTVQLASNLAFGYKSGELVHYFTFGALTILPYTWTGATDNNWFDTSNWSDGLVPNASANVTIPNTTNKPEINNTDLAQANDIDLEDTGASLTLLAGSKMSVNGDITMVDPNSLIIQNDYTNPASFINQGSISNDVQVEWDYPRYMYIYLSHCLNGVLTDVYGTIQTDAWVFSYPSAWSVPGLASGVTLTDDTKQLMGYSAYLADAKTVTTNGTLINGAQSRTLEGSWMLFGNPYSSYIDLDKTSEWDFGDASTTVWYTLLSDPKTTVRATYNVSLKVGVNGGTNIIAPGQSFWIRSYSAGSNFTIYPGARVHSTGGLKSASYQSDDILRLKIGNDNGSDEIAIVFRALGSDFPNVYDSEKYMSDDSSVPLLYAIKESKKMVISVLPKVYSEKTVPLGYKVGDKADGNMNIVANNINQFMPDVSVYLEDTDNDIVYDLRNTPSISFESGVTTNNERFVLHFANISTDIEDSKSIEDRINIRVLDYNNLNITCDWESDMKLVEVYSIDGRLILKDEMSGDSYSRNMNVKSGLYIVKVSDNEHSYQQKVRLGTN